MPFPNKATQFKPGDKLVKRANARKGGLVRSDKKKLAATFRILKNPLISKDMIDKLMLKVASPELSLIDWGKHISVAEEHHLKEGNIKAYGNIAYMKERWHKAAHGEKIHTENVHHVINWTEVIDGCRITKEDLQDEEDS